MIPAAFEYHAPTSLGEATALLARLGEDAKVLSGGQSLIPLMKLRLASPPHVIDINGIPGLAGIREADGVLRIGALTRESDLEESELVRTRYPLLHETARVIADPLVRNLATVGGNLAHGDPANDHPATMLALGAEIVATGPRGERRIPIAGFFTGPFATALDPGEILVEIRVPAPAGRSGGAYVKMERKVGDFATAAVAGGTLEIYVEPYLPTPVLVLLGHGPVVATLATLGRAAGYDVVPLADDAAWTGLDALGLGRSASVVVATHADSDEDALERVLKTEAGYVSLVASRRRATAVVERLRRRGVPSERLGRFKAPAGLDLGAVTPAEIAVSILAEIIQHHRGDKAADAAPAMTAAEPTEARDPICGMTVEIATARYRSQAAGRITYFCCLACKETFEQDPGGTRADARRSAP